MLRKKNIKPRIIVLALSLIFSGSLYAKEISLNKSKQCTQPNRYGYFLPIAHPFKSGLALPPQGASRLTADFIDGQSSGTSKASGNVILERDDTILNAPSLQYNQKSGEINSEQAFILSKKDALKKDTLIEGQSLRYNTTNETGLVLKPHFAIEHSQGRVQGEGQYMQMLGKGYYRMDTARLNTCEPNDDSWYIQAKRIDTNHNKNIGVAHHARLIFKGVPILYTPWMDFPLNSTRKSGLLTPSFGAGSNGFEIALPYYLNLAANYDATITPHFYSRRGLGFEGEFRYLGKSFKSQINSLWLPKDQISKKSRYDLTATHQQKINEQIALGIHYQRASDNDFYRDLGSRTTAADNINLNQEAWVSYQNRLWGSQLQAQLSVQRYQTLQNKENTLDEPYRIMPRLEANWRKNLGQNGKVSLMAQITRFAHPKKQEGARQVFNPTIEWDFNRTWGFIRPKAALHASTYQLHQRNTQDKRHFSRVLPIFSVDSGLIFERNFNYFDTSYTQTLEPRLFYTYIPTKDQNNLPNFDSSENSFTFEQLFRENRFSGHDRINAANQISTAISTRFYEDKTGIERFRAGLGQRFYLKSDDIDLSGNIHNRAKDQSDFLAFAQGNISQSISMQADWHYDKNNNRSQSYSTALRYHPELGKNISVRFGYDRNNSQYSSKEQELKYLDVGVQWPIRKQYYLLARQNYSLTDKKALDQMFGIAYRSDCDCWNANFVFQRYVTDYQKTKNAFFFQLQFRGLGGAGNNLDEEAKLAVPGYNSINEVK